MAVARTASCFGAKLRVLAVLAGLSACIVLPACSGGGNSSEDDASLPLGDAKQELPWADVAPGESPLNLLLLSLDTTRADHLSCYGFAERTTPHLDRLVKAGIIFETACSPVPITLPAHATMLTGLYPYRHGVRTNGLYVLGEDRLTLAELLQQRGYDTGAVLGAFPVDSRFGLAQGFLHYDDDFSSRSERRGGQMAERDAQEVTRLALQWLDRDRKQPFFLWCHYFDPHAPYTPPEPYSSRFATCAYCGEIAAMDAAIGDLLGGLATRGLLERTVVIVAGDHGESLGEHGEKTHAFFIYDATLRIPLLLRLPRAEPFGDPVWRGRRLSGLVNLTDLMPTAWNALGFSRDDLPAGDGQSLLPLIRGESGGHDWLYHESLLPQLDYGAGDLRSLRVGSWKYIRAPRPELYDLQADPDETVNLAGEREELVRSLEARLQGILRDEVSGRAGRPLDPQALARLRSLGYVTGGQSAPDPQAPAVDPKDLAGYAEAAERAYILSYGNSQERALALVDSLLAVFEEPVFVHQLRGKLLLGLDRPAAAIAACDEAIARCGDCPHQGDLLLQRAMATYAAGRPDDALAQTEVLIRQGERTLGLRLFLAEVWEAKGDSARARQALREEADLWPGQTLPLVRLGELEATAGRIDAAEEAYRRALSIDSQDPAALVALGELLADTGRDREAASLVARALAVDPSHPRANLRRGLELQQSGHDEEALRCFETAMQGDPRDPLAPTLLGTALIELGRPQEALSALQSAIGTGLAAQEAYANLGVVHFQMGRLDEAVAVWQEGISREPDGPYAEQMRAYVRQAQQTRLRGDR